MSTRGIQYVLVLGCHTAVAKDVPGASLVGDMIVLECKGRAVGETTQPTDQT